ncbi:hypothetical protein B566_EDAN008174 [Ephemera danica]|nr:hypothetical protein B566_EDAN008174 [Ephemera danica]
MEFGEMSGQVDGKEPLPAASGQLDKIATAMPVLAPSAATAGPKVIPTINIDSGSDEEFGAEIVAEVVAAAIQPAVPQQIDLAPVQTPQQQRRQQLLQQVQQLEQRQQQQLEQRQQQLQQQVQQLEQRQQLQQRRQQQRRLATEREVDVHPLGGARGRHVQGQEPSAAMVGTKGNVPNSSRASSPELELQSSRPTTPEAPLQRASTAAPAALKRQTAAASHHALMEALDREAMVAGSRQNIGKQATAGSHSMQQGAVAAGGAGGAEMLLPDFTNAHRQPRPPTQHVEAMNSDELCTLELTAKEYFYNLGSTVDMIVLETKMAECDYDITMGTSLITVYAVPGNKKLFATFCNRDVADMIRLVLRKRDYKDTFENMQRSYIPPLRPKDSVSRYISSNTCLTSNIQLGNSE